MTDAPPGKRGKPVRKRRNKAEHEKPEPEKPNEREKITVWLPREQMEGILGVRRQTLFNTSDSVRMLVDLGIEAWKTQNTYKRPKR